MCRSIKQLRNTEIPATEEEIRAAALQFVRKVSGYRKPSKVNQVVFDQAVDEVTQATQRLLEHLNVHSHLNAQAAVLHVSIPGGDGGG
ncbi:MAG TPA: DUF2277 domain-containing protein [Anaerolineales bacterium]|nr:DUF2277 domain-containing protein [Anaerolineales bacterium]